jgi:ferredoxin-NADP reductase/ferredoxin
VATDSAVVVDGREIPLLPGESVLEALERSGIDVPSGCRSGVCKKCMLRAEGDVPAGGRNGLRPQLAVQGYFLACRTKPAGRLVVLGARGPEPIGARLERAETVAADVARLFLRPEVPFDYRPGQYIDLLHPSGISRSYSMASLPADGLVELHVRRVPGGVVSAWLHELRLGSALSVRGPFGQCFHIVDDPRRKLLLVGAGTGLAPLLGIARDALDQGHTGPIDLVHGGLDPSRLYLRDELERLAARWPQLRVHHCVLRDAGKREHEGALDEVAIRLAGPLAAARAFVCGDDAIVRRLQRSLFMAGVPSQEILADPFAPAPAPSGRQ